VAAGAGGLRPAKEMSCSHCLRWRRDSPVLVGMGLMMWIMMRGHRPTHQTINPGSQQIEELRAEIGRLKAERATDTGSGPGPVTVGMTVRSKPASSQLVAANDLIYYLRTYVVGMLKVRRER
jgi:hypothetical protein